MCSKKLCTVANMYFLKNILFVISTILLIKAIFIGCTNTSTVCYGAVPACTTHTLYCPSPLVIQIINTSYGYRPECNNIAISNCDHTACCNEEPGDCFVQFLSRDNQRVAKTCIGVQTCYVSGFREVSGTKCGGTTSAYSKIQYTCVTKGSSIATPTTYSRTNTILSTVISTTTSVQTISQPIRTSTETAPIPTSQTTSTKSSNRQDDEDTGADVGSIVGGIFGAIIIIVIIIVVVVFLYKRKKNSATPPETDKKTTLQAVTPHYHVIDGPGTINNRKDISGYDEIELDSKPRVPITDNYDHVGDNKLKLKTPKEHDNYNHIGAHNHSIDEDNYNHIGNNLSFSGNHLDSDYNHVNGVRGSFNDEDEYNHIGDNDNKIVITDDNYHHIGSEDIKVEGDYDHIHDDNDIAHNDSNNIDDSEAPYNFATC